MTAILSSKPEQMLDKLTRISSDPGKQAAAASHERSLTEILSLTDAKRFVPETIGLLALIVVAQLWLTHGTGGPGNLPHPFLIPVLLMSAQYGIMGGLFAALAASAAFFMDGVPELSATQDFYDRAAILAAQPCAWFGSALILGGLRTLHIHNNADLRERFEQMWVTAEDLASGLERSVSEIERLEHRIATDHGTFTALLHSFAKLDMTDQRSLCGSVADMIRSGIGATSFAVYLRGPHGFAPCVGVVDGTVISTAAIPPLPGDVSAEAPADANVPSPATDDVDTPIWALMRGATGEPVGVIVCSRLHPSRDPAGARRRLPEVCRVLATLLAVCPRQDHEEG